MEDLIAKIWELLTICGLKVIAAVVELVDSSVNFVVRPWVKSEHYWDVYFGTTENIKKSFDSEGISIPFPQRDVHMYEHKE